MESVTVPAPALIIEPGPLRMPLMVVSLASPKVKFAFKTVLPAPAKEATVSLLFTI